MIQREKLLRRTRVHRGQEPGSADLEMIRRRSGRAFQEIQTAPEFDWVIPNHDGEDHENWCLLPEPIGDAGRTLKVFASLLRGESSPLAEKWKASIL